MDASTSDERGLFSARLKIAIANRGFATSPTRFAYEFNLRADGATVSVHGARKWLVGESIPTQARIQILADWLEVGAAWLRFGAPENADVMHGDSAPVVMRISESAILRDIRMLSRANRRLLRSIIDTMLLHETNTSGSTNGF